MATNTSARNTPLHRLRVIRQIARGGRGTVEDRLQKIADLVNGNTEPSDHHPRTPQSVIAKNLRDGQASRTEKATRGEPGGFDRMEDSGTTRKKSTPKKKEEPKSDGTSA